MNATALAPTDSLEFEQHFVVAAPKRWSPETPVLYAAVSKLYAGDKLCAFYSIAIDAALTGLIRNDRVTVCETRSRI